MGFMALSFAFSGDLSKQFGDEAKHTITEAQPAVLNGCGNRSNGLDR